MLDIHVGTFWRFCTKHTPYFYRFEIATSSTYFRQIGIQMDTTEIHKYKILRSRVCLQICVLIKLF